MRDICLSKCKVFSGLKRYFFTRSRAMHKLLPLMIGLTPLFWLFPFKDMISIYSGILTPNPFSFNSSPLIPYHYTYSYVFPINDNVSGTFFSLILYALHWLSSSWVLTEYSTIILLATLQAYGIFYLLGVINEIQGKNVFDNVVSKVLISVLFLYNPFTLSVTWWSIEGWTVFYTLMPFFVGLFLEILFLMRIRTKRYLWALVLMTIFSFALNGPLAVPFLYTILMFVLYAFFTKILSLRIERPTKTTIKQITFLMIPGLAITIPLLLPYVLLPLHGQYAPGYVTTSNYLNIFFSQSETTQLQKVITLFAFNWIYHAPSTYPWIRYSDTIKYCSYGLIVLLLVGIYRIRASRILRFFYIFMIAPIVFSVGHNFPFGSLNLALLKLGGPFLIVVNAYYIIGELYVISLLIITYITISSNSSDIRLAFSNTLSRIHNFRLYRSPLFVKVKVKNDSHNRMFKVIAVSIVLVLIGVYTYPFINDNVYTSSSYNGPLATEVYMPTTLSDSLSALHSYLTANYQGPYYNVLILPLSSNGIDYIRVGNTSWQDSSEFYSTYIPYPLIQGNNSPLAFTLDSYLATCNYTNLSLLMQYLHVKYIIYNHLLDMNQVPMDVNSEGYPMNYTYIQNVLNRSFGQPLDLGYFLVYDVKSVAPVIEVVQSPIFLSSTSLNDIYELLGSVSKPSDSFERYIGDVVLNGRNSTRNNQMELFQVTNFSSIYKIPTGYAPFALLRNGSTQNLDSPSTNYSLMGIRNRSAGFLSIEGNVLLNSYSANISSNFVFENGTYTVNGTGYLASARPLGQNFAANFNITNLSLGQNSHIIFQVTNGILSYLFQIYTNESWTFYTIVAAGGEGNPFAWGAWLLSNNILSNSHILLTLTSDNGEIGMSIGENGNREVSSLRAVPPFLNSHNTGYNYKNWNITSKSSSNFTFSINAINSNFKIDNFSLYRPSPIKYLLLFPNINLTDAINYSLTYNYYNGNYNITLENGSISNYTLILYYPDFLDLWKISIPSAKLTTDTATMFFISGKDSRTITLYYSQWINTGFAVLVVELVFFLSLIAILVIRDVYNNYRR